MVCRPTPTLASEIAVLAVSRIQRAPFGVFLFEGLLVAQAHQDIGIPAAAFLDEMAAQMNEMPYWLQLRSLFESKVGF